MFFRDNILFHSKKRYVYVTTDKVLKFGYFETKCYEQTKQLYLGLRASDEKNKMTLFPETLKVTGYKVVLFFGLEAHRPRYNCFVIS